MRLFKRAGVVLTATWGAVGLTLLTEVLVARLAGPEGKGVVTLYLSCIAILSLALSAGIPQASVYFLAKGTQSVRSLTRLYLPFVAAPPILVLLASTLGPARLPLPEGFRSALDGGTAWLAAGSIGSMTSLLLGSLFLGRSEVRNHAFLTIALPALDLAGLGLLVSARAFTTHHALLVLTVPRALAAVTWLAVEFARAPRIPDPGPSREVLAYGFRHHVGSIGALAFKRLDPLILALFVSADQVGYYSIGLAGYLALLSVPRSMTSLVTHDVSSKTHEEGRAVTVAACRLTLAFMLALALAAWGLGILLIPTLFGAAFTQAVRPLPFLLFAAVFTGVSSTLQAWFLGTGTPGVNGALTVVGGLVNIGLSVLLIPRLGIVGNAVGTLAASILTCVLHALSFSRRTSCPAPSLFLPDFAGLGRRIRSFLPAGRSE